MLKTIIVVAIIFIFFVIFPIYNSYNYLYGDWYNYEPNQNLDFVNLYFTKQTAGEYALLTLVQNKETYESSMEFTVKMMIPKINGCTMWVSFEPSDDDGELIMDDLANCKIVLNYLTGCISVINSDDEILFKVYKDMQISDSVKRGIKN